MKLNMANIQMLGRALMLPIAVLPIAGLLLRLGQPDLLNIPFVAEAGTAIFSNLGLLFAIGVAVGFAKENHGAAGLGGVVCYLVAVNGATLLVDVPADALQSIPEDLQSIFIQSYREGAMTKFKVPIGIISGIISGVFYNRFSDIRLPEYLAFFGGRRFVPIISGLAGLGLAAIVGFGYEVLTSGIDALSNAVVETGGIGVFIYGVLNRILIVTGLHHILNNVAWFILGEYNGATGDLNRFFAGDPDAGTFMSGFFPVMMFGLPAACLAMYHAARPERKKETGGMLFSMALTSFLTGVTEPIEFTFMFLAPVLYALHAVLTGFSMLLMDLLGVKMGFGFSAGLFDYVLNFGKATAPLMLLPMGAVYALVYYFGFRWFISTFDLKTPGRDDVAATSTETDASLIGGPALAYLNGLGGNDNLVSIGACTTRLRLEISDKEKVSESALKAAGARGIIFPSDTTCQVIIGPLADQIARDLKQLANDRGDEPIRASEPVDETRESDPKWNKMAAEVLNALGGNKNIQSVAVRHNRLVVGVNAQNEISKNTLLELGARDVFKPSEGKTHIIWPTSILPIEAAIKSWGNAS